MRAAGDPNAALTFLGAVDTVTGSRFLLETGGARVLVDAGLYQGLAVHRRRNWEAFPVDPAGIDHVVLTPTPTSTTPATCPGWSRTASRAG